MFDSNLFELMITNDDQAVAVYDEEGNFLYVNHKMIRWRKISYKEYLNMNVHDFYDSKNADDCVFDRVMKTKMPVYELQEYKGWGEKRQDVPPKLRLCRGVPVFDKNGNVQYVICYFQEINEFQKLLDKLMLKKKVLYRKELGNKEKKCRSNCKQPRDAECYSPGEKYCRY